MYVRVCERCCGNLILVRQLFGLSEKNNKTTTRVVVCGEERRRDHQQKKKNKWSVAWHF
jgi:hypothetical protein